MMISHTPRNYDAGPMLGNISKALREVAVVVARLEEASLHLPLGGGDVTQKTKTLQDFDLTLQSLADLALLMDALGKHGPPQTVSEQEWLISEMRLAWLRDLIGGILDPSDHDTARMSIF
jgi:hypothetical protein